MTCLNCDEILTAAQGPSANYIATNFNMYNPVTGPHYFVSLYKQPV